MEVKQRYFPFHNRSLCECYSSHLRHSAKAESSYSFGNFGRIFLVCVSAPAGMTHGDVLDLMPCTFASSCSAQGDHFSSPKLKASYLFDCLMAAWEIRSERVPGTRW